MFILITLKTNENSIQINIKLRNNFNIECTYESVPGIYVTRNFVVIA